MKPVIFPPGRERLSTKPSPTGSEHGYALDNTPRNLRTAWVAAEESDVAFELRSALEQTGFFRVTRYAQTMEQVDDWFKSGEVTFVVEIPAGFERRLRLGHGSFPRRSDA
jgi:hypothetical protein